MNYFKYLCVVILSCILISCGEENSDEIFGDNNSDSFVSADGDCVRGVYSGNSRFGWIRTPGSSSDYEIEVNYDQNVVIFLVTQQNEGADNGTQLCTSYSFPNFQTSESNDDEQASITISSVDIENAGIIEDTSALYGNIRVAKDAEGNCSTVRAKASRDWSFDPTLVAQKTEKTPRSFNQLRGICDSLVVTTDDDDDSGIESPTAEEPEANLNSGTGI